MSAVPRPSDAIGQLGGPGWSGRSAGRAFAEGLGAELLKLVTLPQLWITVFGMLGVAVVLGAAFANAAANGRTGTTAVLEVGLAPVGYTQAGMILFGILAATSEYSGGQIRTSLSAVPRRLLLQAARTVALVLVAVPIAVCDVLLGVATARIILGKTATEADTHPVAAVTGAVIYLILVTTIAHALGAVVRRSLPTVVAVLGYFFIVGPIVRDRTTVSAYLPDTAGYQLWFPGGADATVPLSRAESGAVIVLWTLLSVTAATMTFRNRDA